MSSTQAYVVSSALAVIVVLALSAAPTSAVGSSDAGANAAAEAIPQAPAGDLTVVQKIRADPALREALQKTLFWTLGNFRDNLGVIFFIFYF